MAVTVNKVVLWRRDVDNRPGALAQVLAPLADTGTDLQIAMGYRIPGQESRAVIELAPVTGRSATQAAQSTGLSPSDIPTLVVEGDNTPGLGHAQARALADAGVNIAFLIAQVVGRRYTAIYGFESQADAAKAAGILKRVEGRSKRKAPAPPAAKARRRPAPKAARKGAKNAARRRR